MFVKIKPKNGVLKYERQKYRIIAKSRAPLNNAICDYALASAIEANNIKLVEFLVRTGVDVNKRGQDTLTPLHTAASHDRPEIIMILWKNGAFVDSILDEGKMRGFTPLHLAVQKNHIKCVKLLLNLGASFIPEVKGVYHPVHYAVFNNFAPIALELFQHGADANIRFDNNFFEENPITMDRSLWLDHDLPLLHYSILQKHYNMITILSFYADSNLKTSFGKTTLMQAVEANNIACVEALVHKKTVNERDNFGQPVLHFTMVNANRKRSMYSKEEHESYKKRLIAVKILVDNGADVNARFPENQERSSIIHYMIKYGFSEGVKYLLFFNNDLNFNEIDMFTLTSATLLTEHLTPDIQNDNNFIIHLSRGFAAIVFLIIQKVISLQTIGLPVDNNLILKTPIHDWLLIENFTQVIDSYKNEISQQINYMKKIEIDDTNVTMWDLLVCKTNKLVKYMSIESVKNFVVNDHISKTVDYNNLLETRLRLAKKKKLYLEEMTEVLSIIFTNILPFDCCVIIASYL